MPKQVKARAAQDPQEERQVRKLAWSHHVPADWKGHAQMMQSELGRQDAQRDRRRVGLPSANGTYPSEAVQRRGDRRAGQAAGSGRKTRLTEQERSRILALAKQEPPGHLSDASRRDHGGPRRGGLSPLDASMRWLRRPKKRGPRQTQPDPTHLSARRSALASHP